MEQKQLEKLLEQMTLEEKVGQMIQVTGKMLAQEGNVITGPTETVQMYLQDIKGSVVRPVKMLRGFQKVTLQPGQQKEVSFAVTEPMLRFYDIHMRYTSEPGGFRVYIGADSDTDNAALFHYREKQ